MRDATFDKPGRTFASPAYLEEPEPGVFTLWRDFLVETGEVGEDGKPVREKMGKRIGPMGRFRVVEMGEKPDFTTSRPDGTVLALVRTEEGR